MSGCNLDVIGGCLNYDETRVTIIDHRIKRVSWDFDTPHKFAGLAIAVEVDGRNQTCKIFATSKDKSHQVESILEGKYKVGNNFTVYKRKNSSSKYCHEYQELHVNWIAGLSTSLALGFLLFTACWDTKFTDRSPAIIYPEQSHVTQFVVSGV
jgi:hypothetical protein